MLAGLSLGWAVLFLILEFRSPPFQALELQARDLQMQSGRTAPPMEQLVFLGFDSASLPPSGLSHEEIEASEALIELDRGWPVNRAFYAWLLDRLFEAGARLVILDLLFPSPRDGDDEFRQALERHGDRVVLSANIGTADAGHGEIPSVAVPTASLRPSDPSLPFHVGTVNFFTDADGVIRALRPQTTLTELAGYGRAPDQEPLLSLTARSLRLLDEEEEFSSGNVPFRFAGPAWTFRPRSIYEIFFEPTWKANFASGEFFRDRVVMVGPSGSWAQDQHQTPFGVMDGAEIHLQALNAAWQDEFLSAPDRWVILLIFLAAGTAAGLLAFGVTRPLLLIATLIGVTVLYLWACLESYNFAGLLLPLLGPVLTFNATAYSGMIFDYIRERLEKARVRSVLERYVSRNVVRELLDNPETYLNSLTGARRPVTVMFTDLRGFTSLAEASDSTALVEQMNQYFRAMVGVVFKEEGTLDKFMGDAIMAVWGNIRSNGVEADALQAVRAAVGMQEQLQKLNNDWKAHNRPTLQMGIGLNAGEAITGNIGSDEKMELTVIGDTVNLASRIEGLCKPYACQILLGDSVAKLVKSEFPLRPIDLVQVKGRSTPVELFSPWPKGYGLENQDRYQKGVADYRAGEFGSAMDHFRFLEQDPALLDPMVNWYLERLEKLVADPPAQWDPVTVMTTK